MDSMIFTEEEIRYYQALLSWEPSDDEDNTQGKPLPLEMPAGQFRFLVLGSKGCGKTSILERVNNLSYINRVMCRLNKMQFCNGTVAGEDQSSDPDEEGRGYRHKMRVENRVYVLDALELPSEHLSSEERLQQAVHITEAAVLVYDVRSRASFDLVQSVHNLICDMVEETRTYGLMLVGSNSDCDDEAREVSWTEGNKLAESFKPSCAFLETSAKTGENVDKLFPQLGEEVLKLRWLSYQEREHAERLSAVTLEEDAVDKASPIKRLARWKSWARPWFQRRLGERKMSSPY
ncbi:P-loop containing nucleoside triphosphate hydrolase protein [Hypoxylon cercidicola]|nr:P-loop containing nucleoside triphosphate hydrolase protein [Hypoxylon cercidicola]